MTRNRRRRPARRPPLTVDDLAVAGRHLSNESDTDNEGRWWRLDVFTPTGEFVVDTDSETMAEGLGQKLRYSAWQVEWAEPSQWHVSGPRRRTKAIGEAKVVIEPTVMVEPVDPS